MPVFVTLTLSPASASVQVPAACYRVVIRKVTGPSDDGTVDLTGGDGSGAGGYDQDLSDYTDTVPGATLLDNVDYHISARNSEDDSYINVGRSYLQGGTGSGINSGSGGFASGGEGFPGDGITSSGGGGSAGDETGDGFPATSSAGVAAGGSGGSGGRGQTLSQSAQSGGFPGGGAGGGRTLAGLGSDGKGILVFEQAYGGTGFSQDTAASFSGSGTVTTPATGGHMTLWFFGLEG